MPMQMGFRWYGEGNDMISLSDIRQIPGVTSIVWALHDKQPGEVWEKEEIRKVQKQLEPYGFNMDVVESVNVHDDIKIGLPTRDKYIANYIQTIRNLAEFGVKVICYNFMPVFDWTRTDLYHPVGDGSTAMFYETSKIHEDPKEMADYILKNANGLTFPGWEPERMAKLDELFEKYRLVTKEKLWENLKYFLEAIMPVCDKYDINMAIHPDDPGWSVFGLPRIISSQEKLKRMMDMVPNKHNGVTFCMGSYGTNLNNDLIATIHMLKGRIHFAHIRNLRFNDGMRDFEESAHLSEDGTFDMYAIIKALYEDGFDGPIRPDHGRMIWGEKAMPGYGLYDRALGAAYLRGLWEAAKKEGEQR